MQTRVWRTDAKGDFPAGGLVFHAYSNLYGTTVTGRQGGQKSSIAQVRTLLPPLVAWGENGFRERAQRTVTTGAFGILPIAFGARARR